MVTLSGPLLAFKAVDETKPTILESSAMIESTAQSTSNMSLPTFRTSIQISYE